MSEPGVGGSSADASAHYRACIEYDGGPFVGWETQDNGIGIQFLLEEAIHTISRQRAVVEGSGRTDAGVHARGQVASFSLPVAVHPEKLRRGLNAVLPPEIGVVSLEFAPSDFHARKSALAKHYRYSVLLGAAKRPLVRTQAFHFPMRVDPAPMQRAAADLVGTHDFTAFAKEAHRKRSCVRTIYDARIEVDGALLHVDLMGSGFLYNMVRIVTGTLLEIGQGRKPETLVRDLLEKAPRKLAGFTVPPHGLCLMKVHYERPFSW